MSAQAMPSLSVVVPFYRAERYIARCVDALLRQTYPADRLEILFVDNNSPDGSADIVSRHARIRLLREPVQGAYAARNRGAKEAAGDIVAFTDADCVARPDWLLQLVAPMRDPKVQIVFGAARPGAGSRVVGLTGSYEESKERFIFSGGEPRLYVGHAGNMAVRKAILEEVGLFLERRRGSDTTMVRRIVDARSCAAARYEPGAEVEHLEVSRLPDYFRKVFIYGASSRENRRVNGHRSLSAVERLRVFRSTAAREELSSGAAVILLAALTTGLCCWYAGALTAAITSRLSFSTPETS